MSDVIGLAIKYHDSRQSTGDKAILKQVRDTVVAGKPHWLSLIYGTTEQFAKGDISAGVDMNGASLRSRLQNGEIVFGYPQESYPAWMDNVVVLSNPITPRTPRLFRTVFWIQKTQP